MEMPQKEWLMLYLIKNQKFKKINIIMYKLCGV